MEPQAPRAAAIAAIAAIGSTEVDEVVPIVATIASGTRPAARSSPMAVASAAGSSSNRSFTGILRRLARPRPRVMHAFSIDEWASAEAYTRTPPARSGRPARPSAAASRPAASRAAARAIRVEVEAVSVSRPSKAGGSPSPWRSQSTTTPSSSVPIGDVRHSIGFWPSAAVSISPRIPGPDAVVPK